MSEFTLVKMSNCWKSHAAAHFIFSRYLVFYSPFDLVYKIARMLPFKMVLCGFKEVQRAHKVYHAVSHTAKLYPSSYLVIIIIGTVKGKNMILVDFFNTPSICPCHFEDFRKKHYCID